MKPALKQGFTLVEAMVSLAILATVGVVMAGTFLVGARTVSKEANTIAADTATSQATLVLVRDLNSANAVPSGTIDRANSVMLTYGSPSTSVTYSVAQGDLIRTVNNGLAQVAARGITSVTIAAARCYVTVTIQPSAQGAAAATLNVSNRPGGCF